MRALGTAFSLGLSVVGISIALMGPVAAGDFIRSVPEPMSALLFGAGLVGAAVIRLRKK